MSLLPIVAAAAAFHLELAFAADNNGGLGNVPTVAASTSDIATSEAATSAAQKTATGELKASQTIAATTGTLQTIGQTVKSEATTAKSDTTNTGAKTTGATTGATTGTTTGTTGSQSFNNFGFTGSQSRWGETMALSSQLSGLSSLSSHLSSLSTKTSGSSPIRMHVEPISWKNVAFVGAIALSTLGLHLL